MDFYPAIIKELWLNRINHTRSFVDITNEQLEVILNCGKSTIHYKNSTWIKSTTNNFDDPWVHMTPHKSLTWWGYIYIRYSEQDY